MLTRYEQNVFSLSEEQEECVRVNFDKNCFIIKGPAGSGKSVVLLRRMAKVYANIVLRHTNERILFVTYTNSLVDEFNKYVEELIGKNKNIDLQTSDALVIKTYYKTFGVFINPMYEVDEVSFGCAFDKIIEHHPKSRFRNMKDFVREEIGYMGGRMITAKEHYIGQGTRPGRGIHTRLGLDDKSVMYDIFMEYKQQLEKGQMRIDDLCLQLCENAYKIPMECKYDYVFTDEAQDLSLTKMKLLNLLCKKQLFIASDVVQKIYKNGFTWKEIGINAVGNVKKLSKTFRCSGEIINLAKDFIKDNELVKKITELEDVGINYESSLAKTGIKPKCLFAKKRNEEDVLLSLLKKLTKEHKKVGVIFRDMKNSLVEATKKCYQNGIKFNCFGNLNKIEQLGINYDKSSNIFFGTMHSSKGLEFDIVVLPFQDEGIFPWKRKSNINNECWMNYLDSEKILFYVAMTRAREQLYFITQGEGSSFIKQLNSELYDSEIF